MLKPLVLSVLALAAWCGEARGIPADHPVRVFELGRYRAFPAPGGTGDPVAALDDADRAALAKPGAKTWDALVDAFAARCAATYAATAPPPAGLAAWLQAHPAQARDLWLAFDPRFDDIAGGLAVLQRLLDADAKRFERFFQLAIAMAVVWDSPDAVDSSRHYPVWGIEVAQLPPRMDLMQVWDWYTDAKRQSQLAFKPTDMPWPVLVNLVDLALSPAEAQWAAERYAKQASDLAALYPQVPYDYDKLEQRPKLGSKPYTLENLKACGGVCVDQSHFATEIAKALGVPAIKCTGEGRYGGAGHAWTGFLAARKGRPLLEFTGRYQFDYYYTGDCFDPQTRTMVMDRDVALLYDAATGGFPALVKARTLARIARAVEKSDPALAVQLAGQAIKTNTYADEAWRIWCRLAAAGAVERKVVAKMGNQLMKDLAAHPDVTIACLDDLLATIPADKLDERVALYEAAYGLYRQAKRPDLQIRLRLAETRELGDANRAAEALTKALETVQGNAAEGTLILPLVEQVVESSLRFRREVKGFRIELVRDGLKKAATDFPKQRGNKPSPAWAEYQQLQAKLD
ncbi:MAG: hypothetical protein J0M02_17525 [Planctomycetes bacterium]|nr:hypothetical protein [Planctomycetota bacterium]